MGEHIGTRPAAHCESCDKLVPLDDLRDFLCAGCRDDAAADDLRAENERLRAAIAAHRAAMMDQLKAACGDPSAADTTLWSTLARDGSPVVTGRDDGPVCPTCEGTRTLPCTAKGVSPTYPCPDCGGTDRKEDEG